MENAQTNEQCTSAGGSTEKTVEQETSMTTMKGEREPENDCATQDGTIEQEREPNTTKIIKLPRENGFGDFCFARFTSWERMKTHYGVHDAEWTDEELAEGSHNVRVDEPNGFERADGFEFMKLPKEIRDRIYKYIAAPCYRLDEQLGEEVIKLTVVSTTTEKAPERLASYMLDMKVEKRLVNGKLPYQNQDWSMIELIRNFSNVSSTVREEFGHVLWKKSSITINAAHAEPLVGFLKERPKICSGVKKLLISIGCYDYDEDRDELANLANLTDFPKFSQYLASELKLTVLHVDVYLNVSLEDFNNGEIRALDEEEGVVFDALYAMRTLKVNKSAYLDLHIGLEDKEWACLTDEEAETCKDMKEIYWGIIGDICYPDTLSEKQVKKPETKEEKYLHSPLSGSTIEAEDGETGANNDDDQ